MNGLAVNPISKTIEKIPIGDCFIIDGSIKEEKMTDQSEKLNRYGQTIKKLLMIITSTKLQNLIFLF